MMVRQSVAEILEKTRDVRLGVCRPMYLNAYVPSVQDGGGFVWFLKTQLGCRVPSTAMIAPQSRAFARRSSGSRASRASIWSRLRRARGKTTSRSGTCRLHQGGGVLFVGKAQEKASVFRTEKRRMRRGRSTRGCPVDGDGESLLRLHPRPGSGPLFLKFCTYFRIRPSCASTGMNG